MRVSCFWFPVFWFRCGGRELPVVPVPVPGPPGPRTRSPDPVAHAPGTAHGKRDPSGTVRSCTDLGRRGPWRGSRRGSGVWCLVHVLCGVTFFTSIINSCCVLSPCVRCTGAHCSACHLDRTGCNQRTAGRVTRAGGPGKEKRTCLCLIVVGAPSAESSLRGISRNGRSTSARADTLRGRYASNASGTSTSCEEKRECSQPTMTDQGEIPRGVRG